jgi:hypothetical protein
MACAKGPRGDPETADGTDSTDDGVDGPSAADGEHPGEHPDPLARAPATLDETGAEPTRAARAFDLEAWAVERGIQAKVDAERCEPAPIGDKPDHTLWCWREAPAKGGFETRIIMLYVVRGQSVAKAFELPIAVAASDAPSVQALVELSPRIEDEGKTVVFSEQGPTCDDVLARIEADHPDEPEARRAKRAAVDPICRRRGRYRFAGGTLRRVGPP